MGHDLALALMRTNGWLLVSEGKNPESEQFEVNENLSSLEPFKNAMGPVARNILGLEFAPHPKFTRLQFLRKCHTIPLFERRCALKKKLASHLKDGTKSPRKIYSIDKHDFFFPSRYVPCKGRYESRLGMA